MMVQKMLVLKKIPYENIDSKIYTSTEHNIYTSNKHNISVALDLLE